MPRNSVDIHQERLTNRTEFGHWQIDMVFDYTSGQDQVLHTLIGQKQDLRLSKKLRKNAMAVPVGIETLQEQKCFFSDIFEWLFLMIVFPSRF